MGRTRQSYMDAAVMEYHAYKFVITSENTIVRTRAHLLCAHLLCAHLVCASGVRIHALLPAPRRREAAHTRALRAFLKVLACRCPAT